MSDKGYCLAYRSAWTHEAFSNLREAAIWNFLYQNAFWEDGQRVFNGTVFNLKRGQIVVSISFLAHGFGMSNKGMQTVIRKLNKLNMIGVQGTNKGTILTIVNYEQFQLDHDKGVSNGVSNGQATGQAKDTQPGNNKNKEMNSNELKKESLFEKMWKIYPKARIGSKQKSFIAYKRAIKQKRATEEEIYNGVQSYRNSREAASYPKGCAAWLNDDRWKIDYLGNEQAKGQAGNGSSLSNAIEVGTRQAAKSLYDQGALS